MTKRSQVNKMRKIINNKRGLSAVITTLIIILLVIVSVGIVWTVVKGVIDESIGGVTSGVKCLDMNVYASNVVCNPAPAGNDGTCSVTLRRSASGGNVAGVKLVFTNKDRTENFVKDEMGNLVPLSTKTISNVITRLPNITTVDVHVYIEDDAGKIKVCDTKQTTEIEL
jgi:hypothetical protein